MGGFIGVIEVNDHENGVCAHCPIIHTRLKIKSIKQLYCDIFGTTYSQSSTFCGLVQSGIQTHTLSHAPSFQHLALQHFNL